MAPQLDQLFNSNRFQDRAPILFLLLMAYFPIGIVLLVLRILISFQYFVILAVLPKGFVLRQVLMRIHLFLIGILVTTDGTKGSGNIVVSNYLSYLDSIVIEAVFPTQRLGKQTNVPGLFKWLLGFVEDDTSCMGLEAFDYEYPISFFPEEDTTNGQYGLLKFAKHLFKRTGLVVQPIVVSSCRPKFFPVNIHCLTSSFWSDLLWVLFFPCTKFHISMLDEREIPVEEERDDFIKKLETDIAGALSIEPTLLTAKDKGDFIKRLAHEKMLREQIQPKPRGLYKEASNKNCEMAKQVKLVLPQVPMSIIECEIKKTKNVDRTITNFLDGSIKFKPLTEEEQQKEKEILNKKKVETIARPVNSSLLAGTSKDRHLSFQEKKELMIEEARTKYLQKHPEYT